MKSIILLLIFSLPSIALSADPFMGHGKENYIKICVSAAGTPGYNVTKKRIYCTCFANKLEANYDKIMEALEQTLESTGDPEKAQNEANEIANKYALECIDLIK